MHHFWFFFFFFFSQTPTATPATATRPNRYHSNRPIPSYPTVPLPPRHCHSTGAHADHKLPLAWQHCHNRGAGSVNGHELGRLASVIVDNRVSGPLHRMIFDTITTVQKKKWCRLMRKRCKMTQNVAK
jgi:hypothetical protein